MAEFFYEYGLFFLKALTFVIAVVVILMAIVAAAMRSRESSGGSEGGHISIKKYIELRRETLYQELAENGY